MKIRWEVRDKDLTKLIEIFRGRLLKTIIKMVELTIMAYCYGPMYNRNTHK